MIRLTVCCDKCGFYKDCHQEIEKNKRGAKIKYNDPIHEAWRISSHDRYLKMKTKEKEIVK